jgi:hypothetical protein
MTRTTFRHRNQLHGPILARTSSRHDVRKAAVRLDDEAPTGDRDRGCAQAAVSQRHVCRRLGSIRQMRKRTACRSSSLTRSSK